MRICCIQLGASYATREDRIERVRSLFETLEPVELVLLPELWPVGFFRFDDYVALAEPLDGVAVTVVRELARRRGLWIAGGSFVERAPDGRYHNTAFLVDPLGEVVLTYRKIHLFTYRSREAELLSPGEDAGVVDTPFGKVALTTCYDLRFPELYRRLLDRGAEILLVPAAWPLARVEHWRLLVRARALENQFWVAGCNAGGLDGRTALGGHSLVVDPWSEIVAEAGEAEQLLYAEIDPERLRAVRAEFPVLRDRRL